MATTKFISADSPQWWQQSPMTQTNAPSLAYARLTGPSKLDGKTVVNANPVMTMNQPLPQVRTVNSFNPTLCSTGVDHNVPEKPGLKDVLDLSRINHPAARLKDKNSYNSRHADVLQRESRAFYRTKGAMESYLEDAHWYRDFLVWQPAQPRGNTKANNPSNFKPANDFFDVGENLTDTHRISTSRLMVNRHLTSRNATAGAVRSAGGMSGSKSMGSLMSEMEPVLMKKQTDPPVTKLKLTPRAARREESSHTKNDLAAFERSHHDLVEIENMTKEELIGMITREGLEMPGAVTFDSEQNVYVKERLKKREYLEFIRQELYKTDVPAMCKKGKKLGKNFCVVSIYKSLRGAVRIIAYDTDRSMEYDLYLTAFRLEDLDIRKIPKEPVVVEDPFAFRDYSKTDEEIAAEKAEEIANLVAQYKREWEDWGTLVVERLVLSNQGDLEMGPAKLGTNGLSKEFCLTGRDCGNNREEARKKDPSRVHVTNWFNKM